jgi:hypothetical protein
MNRDLTVGCAQRFVTLHLYIMVAELFDVVVIGGGPVP